MIRVEGYEEARIAGESEKFPVGPQPCVITKITDCPDKSYLIVEFDIAQGELKGHFAKVAATTGNWYGVSYRSYKQNALPFFKAFTTAVEKSNVGYHWDWDEKTLVGKYVIVNFREEEYLNGGEVKTSVKPFEFRSIQAWKDGDVEKNPKKLTLKDQGIADPTDETSNNPDIVDDDLPF